MTANPAFILTPKDIKNIRGYVHSKYASMPSEQRVEIVADAVQRIIHRQLPDFEQSLKQKLTGELIRATALQQQRPVSADDVYKLCLELDQSDQRVAVPLREWVAAQGERLTSVEAQKEKAAGNEWTKEAASASSVPLAALPSLELPMSLPGRSILQKKWLFALLFVLLAASSIAYGLTASRDASLGTEGFGTTAEVPFAEPVITLSDLNELPAELRYANIGANSMRAFLQSRNSLLAEAPYFDDIMQTAEEFDIHPAFLFAITGQEQGFVPKDNPRAKEIVNNPFNVFHSWQDFNTNTRESAQIAARTISRLSKDRPHGTDPFVWINREYAEDPNWSAGVSSIFKSINYYLEQYAHAEKAAS